MRIPYIAGRWVRGRDYYGRQRLIQYLLRVTDMATWVVGTRRMGKTSLLRQLETLTDHPESELVPLFWDIQGCASANDLSYELFLAIEDVAERFTDFGIDVDSLEDVDANVILRKIGRALTKENKQLFLLIDEAEVLIEIGKNEPNWLAKLRKSFHDGRQRTVITSTKLLTQLNEISLDWNTSPFLFGFNLANLWSLDPDSARDLVEQNQQETPVAVDRAVLEDILIHTNRHPYLTQYLCHRLFVTDGPNGGRLRPPEEEDLIPDHLLTGFFQMDFQHLTNLERRILLTVARLTIASEADILAELSDEPPGRIRDFLYGLNKLGHVRQIYDRWAVGNEFLRRWVQENIDKLSQYQDSVLSDQGMAALVNIARDREFDHLQREIDFLEEDLRSLEQQRGLSGNQVSAELVSKIERVSSKLSVLRQEFQGMTNTQAAYT